MNTRTRAGLWMAMAVIGMTLLILVPAGPALAHEDRAVGRYTFVVGFGDEPAYAGFKNSVQLLLFKANGDPVTELGESLKVEVRFGTQRMDLGALEPNFEVGEFGTAGDYRAWFFPTRPGAYTFRFTGSIGNQNVDEEFTSSPTTFGEAEDPTSVEFPVKDPTLGQVAGRLDREFPRIETRLAAVQQQAAEKADSAKALAYIAIGLGALGLIAAVIAGRRRRAS